MRELVRVVKPGGRIAMVEFGLPRGIWRPPWWLYTRIGLRVAGRLVSKKWSAVGIYADGSKESIDAHSLIGAPEAALSILWFAIFAMSLAVLLAHWL